MRFGRACAGWLSGLVGIVALGCSPGDGAETSTRAAIVGGLADEVPELYPGVVALVGSDAPDTPFCTGTLIAADGASRRGVVLTAAHCVAPTVYAGFTLRRSMAPSDVQVAVGARPATGRLLTVREIHYAPDAANWTRPEDARWEDYGIAADDVAVLVVEGVTLADEALVIPLLGRGEPAPSAGDAGVIVGFGATNAIPTAPAMVRQRLATRIEHVIDAPGAFVLPSGACFGDSGGPLVVLALDGSPRVVGVSSSIGVSNPDAQCDARTIAIYVAVTSVLASLIEPVLAGDPPDPPRSCRACEVSAVAPGAPCGGAPTDAEQRFAQCVQRAGPRACAIEEPAGAAAAEAHASCIEAQCPSCGAAARALPMCGAASGVEACDACLFASCCEAFRACANDLGCRVCLDDFVDGCARLPAYVDAMACAQADCAGPCAHSLAGHPPTSPFDAGVFDPGSIETPVRDDDVEIVPFGTLRGRRAEAGDEFGSCVAFSDRGERLIVGAIEGPVAALGRIEIFEPNATTYGHVETLVAGDPQAGVGGFAAISGDGLRVAFAARLARRVHVYGRGGGSWREEARLVPDVPSSDFFGRGIAFDREGRVLALGAPYESPADAVQAGAVYLFERIGASWERVASARVEPSTSADRFGWTLALTDDGRRVLASVPRRESSNGLNAGAIVELERGAGGFGAPRASTVDDGLSLDQLGFWLSASRDGSRAVVSVNQPRPEAGVRRSRVYLLERGADGTSRFRPLRAPPGAAAVGSFWSPAPTISGDGARIFTQTRVSVSARTEFFVHLHEERGGELVEVARLRLGSPRGFNLALATTFDGSLLAVGQRDAEGRAAGSGIVHLYRVGRPRGGACDDSSACATGFCADGVCCDSACAEPDRACSAAITGGVDGVCMARPGLDAGVEPPDAGPPPPMEDGGCDCRAGASRAPRGARFAGLALALAACVRRRRARA
ncbi:MAG: trypsin-like serine protease [Sandaracinaceae bacterium]|nr:trypsin-like serine protease [Sandaracinaceae bacterium]